MTRTVAADGFLLGRLRAQWLIEVVAPGEADCDPLPALEPLQEVEPDDDCEADGVGFR